MSSGSIKEDPEDYLFVFDDINNDRDICDFTNFDSLSNAEDANGLETLELDDEFTAKLNAGMVFTSKIKELDLKEDTNDNEIDEERDPEGDSVEDPLSDFYYELHHKKLKKIELHDHIIDSEEIKDYLFELEEYLDILTRDHQIQQNTQLNLVTGIYGSFKEIVNTIRNVCKVHNPCDSNELIKKRQMCVDHINQMIQNYNYNKFKRSFLIKKKFVNTPKNHCYVKPLSSFSYMNIVASTSGEKAACSSPGNKNPDLNPPSLSIYNSIDARYIYDDVNNVTENFVRDTETDSEEECMVSRLATAEDIKKKRLKKLYSSKGIAFGTFKLNSTGKEIVIEPFRKPYIQETHM